MERASRSMRISGNCRLWRNTRMIEGRPSRTADRVAERRAAHQLLDRPLVFEDPLALAIIDPESARLIRADPQSHDRSKLAKYMRAMFAVRSRFAEDELRRNY